MELKLFVDDLRECPAGWTPARTITEAIRILATQLVTDVSLDHDIMEHFSQASKETFEPVARYMAAMAPQDKENICVRIHTGNVEAGRRMAEILGIEYDNKIFDPKDYK